MCNGGNGFSCSVSDPITELVMTSCDKASIIEINVMPYIEFGVASITVGKEVQGLYAVA